MDQATLSAQNEAYEEVQRLQEKLASLKARRDATAMEMADSDRFLLSLEVKLTALGDAVLPAGTADMRDVLGFMAGSPGDGDQVDAEAFVDQKPHDTAMVSSRRRPWRTGYSLSEREREIAVVIINSKWHSIYPTNAHERAGKAAGLPADKVEALLSGLPTAFDDKREQVVYEMAKCLSESRWVSKGLYDRAVEALGHEGITDVITLMGFYTSVSMTLAFYDVSAGAEGLAR
jgi:hypothetical protein